MFLTIFLTSQISAPVCARAEMTLMPRSEACIALMTIQKHGCVVQSIYRCSDDDMIYLRYEEYDAEGLDFISISSVANEAILQGDPEGEVIVRFDPSIAKTTPVAEVVATGKGVLAEGGEFETHGITRPTSVEGNMVLEPQAVDLNGVLLRRIDLRGHLILPFPMKPLKASSKIYWHAESGLSFEGESELEFLKQEDEKVPTSPAKVLFPGDGGFMAEIPEFDCPQISFDLHLTGQEAGGVA